MEENREDILENQPEPYTPRPAWQVWAARVGVVIMIICIILYYLHIAKGGQL